MSAFVTVTTQIKDKAVLLEACDTLGIKTTDQSTAAETKVSCSRPLGSHYDLTFKGVPGDALKAEGYDEARAVLGKINVAYAAAFATKTAKAQGFSLKSSVSANGETVLKYVKVGF